MTDKNPDKVLSWLTALDRSRLTPEAPSSVARTGAVFGEGKPFALALRRTRIVARRSADPESRRFSSREGPTPRAHTSLCGLLHSGELI